LGAGQSALASGGRQKQHRHPGDSTADPTAGKQIDAAVDAPDDPEEEIDERSHAHTT
jgi:hypothetical protein